jgi:predicted nucleic acid-binding protein
MADTVWLLDTSILIDVLRGSTVARRWIDAQPVSVCAISVITAAELLAGCRNHREQRTVEREIASYQILWLDEDISRTAIDFYQRFHLSHGVGFFDCLIAATALNHDLKIATLNLRHFSPLPAVRAERPY